MFSNNTLVAIERCAVSHIVTILTMCKCTLRGVVSENVADIVILFCDDMISHMRGGYYTEFDANNGLDASKNALLDYVRHSAESKIVHEDNTTWDDQRVIEAMEYVIGYINK